MIGPATGGTFLLLCLPLDMDKSRDKTRGILGHLITLLTVVAFLALFFFLSMSASSSLSPSRPSSHPLCLCLGYSSSLALFTPFLESLFLLPDPRPYSAALQVHAIPPPTPQPCASLTFSSQTVRKIPTSQRIKTSLEINQNPI